MYPPKGRKRLYGSGNHLKSNLIKQFTNMKKENIEELKKLSKEELEKLAILLWDDLNQYRSRELDELFECPRIKENYIKHLECENERLSKAVHGIYQDIKMKSLKFMVDAKPNDATRDIFFNCFKKYIS